MASWTPSSPEEWTATPSWNVSQTVGGLDAGADSAPEGGVEQDHIDGGIQDVGSQLFEVDHHRVGGQWDADHLAGAAHAVQSEDRIFKIVIAYSLDSLAETNGLFGGPDGVRVEAERVARQACGQRAVGLQFVILREDAGFQFVGREAETLLQIARVLDELIDSSDLAASGARVGIAEKTVCGEGHLVTQPAAQNVANRNSPGLSQNVQTGEFESRQNLRPVVVKRRRGVGDFEAHLLQAGRIVPHQVRLHRPEYGLRRLAATAHFAQANQPVVGFHFYDGSHEPAPVTPVGVAQRSLQRDRDRGRADILDLHI